MFHNSPELIIHDTESVITDFQLFFYLNSKTFSGIITDQLFKNVFQCPLVAFVKSGGFTYLGACCTMVFRGPLSAVKY